MRLNNISLPYPVLGINDDITPMLPEDAVKVSVTSDILSYTFEIELSFDNDDIKKLVTKGKAEYSCEYECSRTMLRRCEKSDKPKFSVAIPRKDVNARINFYCFISVKSPIKNYTNEGFNRDYDGAYFDMEKGDILATFPQFHYDVDIKYDKLQAAGAFMQIRESDLHEEVFFDISGDLIEILLPHVLYEMYSNNQIIKSAAEIIHSSLVMNALTFALLELKKSIDEKSADGETRMWGKAIIYRLRTEEKYSLSDLDEPSNIPKLAQRLLKDPYLRLFNNIIAKNSTNSEED